MTGMLLGALYTPIWTSAIFGPPEFGLAVIAFLLREFWRTPPWLVALLAAAAASSLAAAA